MASARINGRAAIFERRAFTKAKERLTTPITSSATIQDTKIK